MHSQSQSQGSFSYDLDLEEESDHPTFPFTLRDLASWLWLHVTNGDHVFRRQCMLCLLELCALLPVPEGGDKNRVEKREGRRGSSVKPPHLQAITKCLFSGVLLGNAIAPGDVSTENILQIVSSGFVHQISQAYRMGVVGTLRSRGSACPSYSPLAHPFFVCSVGSSGGEQVLCPEEEVWLHALNGSLDAYNFLITCVEGCSGSELFPLPPSESSGAGSDEECMEMEDEDKEEEKDKLKGNRKRGREEKIRRSSSGPVHMSGRVLMDSLLRFFACCFHRLTNPNSLRCEALVSERSSRSQYVDVETKLVAQESLMAEVLRRACQLLTTLLRTELDHFRTYLQAVGFLVRPGSGSHAMFGGENEGELVMFVQFVLMTALTPLQINLTGTSTYAATATQLLSSTLQEGNTGKEWLQAHEGLEKLMTAGPERMAAGITSAHQGALLQSAAPSSSSSLSEITSGVSSSLFLFPCTQRVGDRTTRGDSEGQVEEIIVNLPIAIQQLFTQATTTLPLLYFPLWASLVATSLCSLSSGLLHRTREKDRVSSIFLVGAFGRALAVLQPVGVSPDLCMLPRLFPGWHASVLPILGGHVVETVFGALANAQLSRDLTGGEGRVPAPVEVEVGSALLRFAVNKLCLPLAHAFKPSLLSILFGDHKVDRHSANGVAAKSIRVYGTVLVDLFLQPSRVTGASDVSIRGQEVLEELVRRLDSSAAGQEGEGREENNCVKLLFRKVLAGAYLCVYHVSIMFVICLCLPFVSPSVYLSVYRYVSSGIL